MFVCMCVCAHVCVCLCAGVCLCVCVCEPAYPSGCDINLLIECLPPQCYCCIFEQETLFKLLQCTHATVIWRSGVTMGNSLSNINECLALIEGTNVKLPCMFRLLVGLSVYTPSLWGNLRTR